MGFDDEDVKKFGYLVCRPDKPSEITDQWLMATKEPEGTMIYSFRGETWWRKDTRLQEWAFEPDGCEVPKVYRTQLMLVT